MTEQYKPLVDYRTMTVPEQRAAVEAELGHVPQLIQAHDMWQGLATWLESAEHELGVRQEQLKTVWTDGAHTEVDTRLTQSRSALSTWSAGIKALRMAELVDQLATGIGTTNNTVQGYNARWEWTTTHSAKSPRVLPVLTPAGKKQELDKLQQESGAHMNALAQAYAVMANLMKIIETFPAWPGPRNAVPEPGGLGTDPGLAGAGAGDTGGAGDPSSIPDPALEDPAPTPDTPTTTNPTTTTDPVTDALDIATAALNALSELMQSGAGDGTVPDPVTLPDPVDLGSVINPATLPDYANGLPSLAGDAGAVATTEPAASLRAAPMAAGAAPTATPLPTGLAAAAAGAGGYPPPMHPPQSGAAKGNTGSVKPGTADQAVSGRPRDRSKSSDIPGVALRGRRSGAKLPAPAAKRRWDAQESTIRLLDEELWQISQPEVIPEGQTPRKGN